MLRRLFSESGVISAIDTVPVMADYIVGQDSNKVNRRSSDLNEMTKRVFEDVDGLWIRDIREWSELFHKNPDCVADDGVHVHCELFKDVYVGLFMNLISGNVRKCTVGGDDLCANILSSLLPSFPPSLL